MCVNRTGEGKRGKPSTGQPELTQNQGEIRRLKSLKKNVPSSPAYRTQAIHTTKRRYGAWFFELGAHPHHPFVHFSFFTFLFLLMDLRLPGRKVIAPLKERMINGGGRRRESRCRSSASSNRGATPADGGVSQKDSLNDYSSADLRRER